MGMCFAMHSVSDENIAKILEMPELIWRLIAPEEPELFEEAVKQKYKKGLFSGLFGKKQSLDVKVPELNFVEGENIEDDLDKAWQGIHYCINKTAYDAEPPLDFITVGGEVVGDIEVGYGPARVLRSKTTSDIHNRLINISEKDVSINYNPKAMDLLDIYPNIWQRDGNEGLEYIIEYYLHLKTFVANCVKDKLGMAVYLC